jgi:fructokinase
MIYTIGETMYDIIFREEIPVAAKPGGAMLNTSVSVARLGLPVSFISEMGMDKPGQIISAFLKTNNVTIDKVYYYDDGKTGLALAYLDAYLNAVYSFYKIHPQNRLLVDFPELSSKDIVLFGSFFSINSQVRARLIQFLNKAKNSGALLLYDPNFRKSHLNELPAVSGMIEENIAMADIIRGSDDDFQLIFNTTDLNEVFYLVQQGGSKILICTAGNKPVNVFGPFTSFLIPVPQIKPVSTVGAGDSFNAGLIYCLASGNYSRNNLNMITPEEWRKFIDTGIRFGTHVCMTFDNYISREFASEISIKTGLKS